MTTKPEPTCPNCLDTGTVERVAFADSGAVVTMVRCHVCCKARAWRAEPVNVCRDCLPEGAEQKCKGFFAQHGYRCHVCGRVRLGADMCCTKRGDLAKPTQ